MVDKKIRDTAVFIATTMVEFGLGEWKVRVVDSTDVLAETFHYKKEITFSKKFLKITTREQLFGVMYHEIAHAILGPGHGHGEKFIEMCREIGVPDEYITSHIPIHVREYTHSCGSCTFEASHDRDVLLYCPKCFEREQEMNVLEIKKNNLKVVVW